MFKLMLRTVIAYPVEFIGGLAVLLLAPTALLHIGAALGLH